MRCEALTKKGQPCPNDADRFHEASNRWLCHIHNPDALFRKQIDANREWCRENPRKRRRR